jgi:hypothetical protein
MNEVSIAAGRVARASVQELTLVALEAVVTLLLVEHD